MKNLSFVEFYELRNIDEMFQDLGLEGIQKKVKGANIFYQFEDKGLVYQVDALSANNDYFLNEKLAKVVPMKSFSGVMVNAYSPYLTWFKKGESSSDDSLNVSKVGNFGFVYNKLLSSIKDLIENHKVDLLKFEGYTAGMDSVYYKMIQRFRSMGEPKFFFHPVGNNEWISQQFISTQNIMIKRAFDKIIAQEENKHQNFIKRIKAQRNRERPLVNPNSESI